VNVHVASVSAYIPSVEATNDVSSVAGHDTDTSGSATLLTQKQIQIEVQKQDSQERTTIWDAEKISRLDSLDEDAEFEDDPDFPKDVLHDTAFSKGGWTPMGTRDDQGDIVPFSVLPRGHGPDESNMEIDAGERTQELLFTGRAECIPDCVRRLVGSVDCSVIFLIIRSFRTMRTSEYVPEASHPLKKSLCPPWRTMSLFPHLIFPCRGTLWLVLLLVASTLILR
jgi:hypothetical protein